MNVKQAAEYAGVSPALVYQWCAERRLPHMRLGARGRRGKITISQTDLDAFLQSCRVVETAGSGGEPEQPAEPESASAGAGRRGPGIDLW